MKHHFFHKAIQEAYTGLISGDAIPSYFIYFTVNPSLIDVNIHPTKTEIKFHRAGMLKKRFLTQILVPFGVLTTSCCFTSEAVMNRKVPNSFSSCRVFNSTSATEAIQLLPDSVANQIAAGEVVQRPASVVKELMENAVDAGAKHIQVVLKNVGKALIQVIDDGKGMSALDARMAFERHATSKISSAQDLFHLQTLGFRGEALPSIASVAEVELKTRQYNGGRALYDFSCCNLVGYRIG